MKKIDHDFIVSFLGVILVFGIIGGMVYAQYDVTHSDSPVNQYTVVVK